MNAAAASESAAPVANPRLYERAAACYNQAGLAAEAVRCYRLAGVHRLAADLSLALGDYPGAAADYELSGLPELAAWLLVHFAADPGAARAVIGRVAAADAGSAASPAFPLRRRLVLSRCALAEDARPATILPVMDDVCTDLADPERPYDRFTEEWAIALAEQVARFDQVALVFAAAVRGQRRGAAARWAEWAGRVLGIEVTVPDVPEPARAAR
jgi:hypothetical protein